MPRAVLLSTGLLAALAAGLGLWLQGRAQIGDPSGLIEQVAAHHVAQHGGDETACMGWLTETGIMVEVRCDGTLYAIDADGRIAVLREDGT